MNLRLSQKASIKDDDNSPDGVKFLAVAMDNDGSNADQKREKMVADLAKQLKTRAELLKLSAEALSK